MFEPNDTYSAYVNLDYRTDRRKKMELSLTSAGIQAERVRGIPWYEIYNAEGIQEGTKKLKNPGPWQSIRRAGGKYNDEYLERLRTMYARTPGAIGCYFSQVGVMEEALKRGKHAWVMEDDLVFCEDIQERLAIIEEFCHDYQWDIFWLGSTFHKQAKWHISPHRSEMANCQCTLNKDWDKTGIPRIVQTYGCWSTYCYIVNHSSIKKVLDALDSVLHETWGIDWSMIHISPQMKFFSLLPGSVKQTDGKSDISPSDLSKFSWFKGLGRHWYQERMEDYNPLELSNSDMDMCRGH